MSPRSGYELPLLLMGAFRALVDDLHAELAARGHQKARPVHGFALQAIGPAGATTSELGRRLGVSKQAAAKTVASLASAGYVARAPDPGDGRATVLTLTPRAFEMLRLSAEIFDQLRSAWALRLGPGRLELLEGDLAALAGEGSMTSVMGTPGWLS